jgi:hypothetical protein
MAPYRTIGYRFLQQFLSRSQIHRISAKKFKSINRKIFIVKIGPSGKTVCTLRCGRLINSEPLLLDSK